MASQLTSTLTSTNNSAVRPKSHTLRPSRPRRKADLDAIGVNPGPIERRRPAIDRHGRITGIGKALGHVDLLVRGGGRRGGVVMIDVRLDDTRRHQQGQQAGDQGDHVRRPREESPNTQIRAIPASGIKTVASNQFTRSSSCRPNEQRSDQYQRSQHHDQGVELHHSRLQRTQHARRRQSAPGRRDSRIRRSPTGRTSS